MKFTKIAGATRCVGLDQNYKPLYLLDDKYGDGTPFMVTEIQLDEAEIERLRANGGKMHISILGTVWPPILPSVPE